jgi:hypothetical protein
VKLATLSIALVSLLPQLASAEVVAVTSVTPNFGSVAGGNYVTIKGQGFFVLTACSITCTPAVVYFGSTPTADFLVVDNFTIVARVPSHAPATVDVGVAPSVPSGPPPQIATIFQAYTFVDASVAIPALSPWLLVITVVTLGVIGAFVSERATIG